MKPKSPGDSLRPSLVFYALVSLIAFAPCLLTGRAYFDNDLLAEFGPWRLFLKNELASGHFPLWNPFHLCGQPFFADLQNMMLYPLHWPTLLFSVPLGLTLFFAIHMFWAALGTHLWLRSLYLSEKSCRIGALLFSSSSFFWMELIHPPVLAAFSWLPWLFLALEILARDPRPRSGFFSGLCLAMLFLAGSPQVTLGAVYGGGFYFLFRFWGTVQGGSFKRAMTTLRPGSGLSYAPTRKLIFTALLFLWGSLPLLGQLIPTVEFASLTSRWNPDEHSEKINANLSLRPSSFFQILFPRSALTGKKTLAEAIQSTDPEENFWPSLGYLGVWVPFLILGSLNGRSKGVVYLLWGISVFTLLLCLGVNSPLLSWMRQHLPGFGLIQVPYRYIYMFVLAVVPLAAFGYEAWVFMANQRPGKKWLIGTLIYAVLLYWAALQRPLHNWREILELTVGLLGLWAWGLTAFPAKVGELLFKAALLLPLLFHGWSLFRPGPAANFNFLQNSKALVSLGESLRPGRVLFEPAETFYPIQVDGKKYILNFPQNTAFAFGLKDFMGYNPLQLASHKEITGLPQETIFRIGAIRGIVTQKDHGIIPGLTRKAFPPFLFYASDEPFRHVFAPLEAKFTSGSSDTVTRMADLKFDPARTAFLSVRSSGEEFPKLPSVKTPARLTYQLAEDSTDRQVFTVELDQDNLLVFCETMFPGWKAFLDGKPAPLYTADLLLRALIVPSGKHQVEFRFRPFWWPAIPIGLCAWLLLTLGGFMIYRLGLKTVRATLLERITSGTFRGPGRTRGSAPTGSRGRRKKHA